MKLSMLANIVENTTSSEDDPFADLPSVSGADLVDRLDAKLKWVEYHEDHLHNRIRAEAENVPGHVNMWHYPNGMSQFRQDVNDGKLLRVGNEPWAFTNSPEGQLAYKKFTALNNRASELRDLTSRIKGQLTRAKKKHAETLIKNSQAGGQHTNIPEASVPQIVKMVDYNGNEIRFNNPYYTWKADRFAGMPSFFKWSSSEAAHFVDIENALKAIGCNGFDVVYASTDSGQSKPHRNFIAVGCGGRILWRKVNKRGSNSIRDRVLWVDSASGKVHGLDPARFAIIISNPSTAKWQTDLVRDLTAP